jgi:DNA-binding LytR/AlgR family response regulator
MNNNATEERVRYNDVLFFLVLIPFINALNYYLTYTNISFSAHTLATFLLDTFQGYVAWWGFRSVIIYLDKRMPYEANPLKRIITQLFFTSCAGLLIIISSTELFNLIAKRPPVPASFYLYDIFIFLIWFFVLNAIYIGLHYFYAMKRIEMLRIEDKKVRTDGFTVKDGKKNLVLAFDVIKGFFADDDYTALITTEEKKYLLDQSLDKIEQSLPGELFFRLNRQFIIHRNIVNGFTKIENGKLNVILPPSAYFPEQIQVSRTKAPDFKNWFKPE